MSDHLNDSEGEQSKKLALIEKDIEESLKDINPNIFHGVKADKKKEILKGITAVSISSSLKVSHSGPLPPPLQLKDYNDIIKNGAERIISMAEKQQEHRIDIEKTVISSQVTQSNRGQIFGFILGFIGLCSGAFIIYSGHDLAGASLSGATLIGLVSVFVIGKQSQSKDLKEKREKK